MSIVIMRQIKFCAGHRLHRHEGKCANLHGHNYRADFYVTSDEIDAVGRVIDFGTLKQLFKGWIDEHWDHGMLLAAEDTEAIEAVSKIAVAKTFILPASPTAEMMAHYLLTVVGPKLLAGTNARLIKVVVWETDESCAAATTQTDLRHEPAPSAANQVGRVPSP